VDSLLTSGCLKRPFIMVGFRTPGFFLVSLFLLIQRSSAGHACTEETTSACPDEAGAQLGLCLQDPEQHQAPTTISSGCSDFIAINQGCEADVEKFCDEAYYSEDTVLCLTEWTRRDDLSEKCQDVLKWAGPAAEGDKDEEKSEEDDGMTESERNERKEWRENRKANRADAVAIRRKEEEKAAEMKYKEEHPEEYAEQQRMLEEEKKQKAEIQRRERLQQAAILRAKRAAAGEDEDAADDTAKKTKKSGGKKGKSWFNVSSVLTVGTLGAIGFGLYYVFANGMIDMGGKKGGRGGGGKKKRG